MSRIYATEPDGTRRLVAIECDFCERRAKPGSAELLEEWAQSGVYRGPGHPDNMLTTDHCPNHQPGEHR